jgi:hypothetical protein
MLPDVRLIGNCLTLFLNLWTHDSTSLWRVELMMRVCNRTVTYLIVYRVIRYWREICQENGCSSINHGSKLNKLDAVLRVVVVQLQHMQWMSLFLLSGLSSTSPLDTRNSTKDSQPRHNCLLASRWTILPNRRWLLQLLGMINFG